MASLIVVLDHVLDRMAIEILDHVFKCFHARIKQKSLADNTSVVHVGDLNTGLLHAVSHIRIVTYLL